MRVQKIKVMTGTMLTLLLSAVSVCPAIARPVGETGSKQLISQTYTTEIAKGTVRSINGTLVTLAMPNGSTKEITITQNEIERLNLQPGMKIVVSLDKGSIARGVRVVEMNVATAQLVRGTITSINSDMVMLKMPNGSVRQILISSNDLTRLNLKPGMEISARLDSQNMAQNVTLLNPNITAVNTTHREEMTVQQRTVNTTPVPVQVQTQQVQTPAVIQTIEVKQQSTEARPVRAMW